MQERGQGSDNLILMAAGFCHKRIKELSAFHQVVNLSLCGNKLRQHESKAVPNQAGFAELSALLYRAPQSGDSAVRDASAGYDICKPRVVPSGFLHMRKVQRWFGHLCLFDTRGWPSLPHCSQILHTGK